MMRFSFLGLATGRAVWKQGREEEGDDTAVVEPYEWPDLLWYKHLFLCWLVLCAPISGPTKRHRHRTTGNRLYFDQESWGSEYC